MKRLERCFYLDYYYWAYKSIKFAIHTSKVESRKKEKKKKTRKQIIIKNVKMSSASEIRERESDIVSY